MKKSGLLISGLFMILSFLFYSTSVIAEEKYGVYDMQKILRQSDAGKKDAEIMKKMEIEKSKPIMEKDAELKKLKEDLDKKKSVLNEDAFQEKQMDFQKKVRDAQIMAKDAADEIKLKDQEMIKKIMPAIEKAIKTVGERGEYTILIEVHDSLYFSKDADLTQR